MAKRDEWRTRRKPRTRIGIGVEIETTGRTKGGGTAEITPKLTIERERRKREGREGEKRGRRRSAEHLLDLRLVEVSLAAKRITLGDPVTVLGPGPRLVALSPRGALGLASREASDAMRAVLAAAPEARLEARVKAAGKDEVILSVALLGATDDGVRAARAVAREAAESASEHASGTAAWGRRGR